MPVTRAYKFPFSRTLEEGISYINNVELNFFINTIKELLCVVLQEHVI